MFEWLESVDRAIVLAVNGAHSAFFDEFFWLVSNRFVWIPLYLIILHLVWKAYGWRNLVLFFGLAIALIAVTDLTSVYFFKETIQRYRPSHNLLLEHHLHFYKKGNGELYQGGQYGFVSSHAVNFFAICFYAGFSLRLKYPQLFWILLAASILVCYSRLYLGVHYFSDLFCGGVWGGLWGYVFYRIFKKYKKEV